MKIRPRRNHTPALKAKMACAAVKSDRMLAQLAEQFDVHPNQITSWKLEGTAVDIFGPGGDNGATRPTSFAPPTWGRRPVAASTRRSGSPSQLSDTTTKSAWQHPQAAAACPATH
jgi:transposase